MKNVIDIVKRHGWLRLLPVMVLAAALGACASIGRPDGGPRDEMPAVVGGAPPRPGPQQPRLTVRVQCFLLAHHDVGCTEGRSVYCTDSL